MYRIMPSAPSRETPVSRAHSGPNSPPSLKRLPNFKNMSPGIYNNYSNKPSPTASTLKNANSRKPFPGGNRFFDRYCKINKNRKRKSKKDKTQKIHTSNRVLVTKLNIPHSGVPRQLPNVPNPPKGKNMTQPCITCVCPPGNHVINAA